MDTKEFKKINTPHKFASLRIAFMGRLSNIPLRLFRGFLESKGLKCIKTTGGHEKWVRYDLRRPVMLQTHIDPVPGVHHSQ